MTYIDLGTFQFTTGQDYSGLNTGNLTSVLDMNQIRVPYFEIYRLVIDTSSLPATSALPSVVQTTGLVTGTSLTTLNLTLPKAATKGNTIVVAWGASTATTFPTISGVTIGGVADNFGAAVTNTDGSNTVANTAIWVDPNCQQASAAIVVTSAGGTGADITYAQAWEISNAFTTSTAAAAVDVTSTQLVTSSATSSFATTGPSTTTANDFQAGFGYFVGSALFTVSNPQGWVANSASGSGAPLGVTGIAQIGASNNAGPAGYSGSFQATTTGNRLGSLVAASFLPTTTPVSAIAYPFKVQVGRSQWDIQMTTAGVGYTYNIGQSPLALNTGQAMYILWNTLPFSTFGGYAGNFKVTAYMRYDPAALRSGMA